jgi:hypothetical protein
MKGAGPNKSARTAGRPARPAARGAHSEVEDARGSAENAAELKLRSRIREMDELDDPTDLDEGKVPDEEISAEFRRRWEDDSSDPI